MTNENKEKIRSKVNLRSHLNELNSFSVKSMSASDLLSLEETKRISNQGQSLRQMPVNKFTIAFEEKISERFKKYLNKLQEANSSGVYIWIERTNDCGTSVVKTLFELNWDFDFSCSENGVLTLVTQDLKDRILFDFFEEDGEKKLEIEVKGSHWSKIVW